LYRTGEGMRATYYVHGTALSLLQPGREADYDPRALTSSMIRETVVFPGLLQLIMREAEQDQTQARAMARFHAETETFP
jgi:hypothetical protein